MTIARERPALAGKRIKVFTRSFDLKLYTLSKGLYKDIAGIKTERLTDQKADGYFYSMLKDTSCDIAINIDEDAFITDPEAMLDLAEYVIENGYANAGCPDGGGYGMRGGNPIVTNPFFNIFDLNLIRTKYTLESVKNFNHTAYTDELFAKFPKEVLKTHYRLDRSDLEPYYKFFYWLAYNFKTLYLPSGRHKDGITTVLYNQNQQEICLHTWYARFYAAPTFVIKIFQPNKERQKERIDGIIDEAYSRRGIPKPAFSAADKLGFAADKTVRWCIKVPQRIAGWPRKLSKRLRKKVNAKR